MTHVAGERSFAGRYVKFQRRTNRGTWVTVKRLRLNRRSTAIFRAKLPHGAYGVRIAMSVNQAGAGYLGGFSRTILIERS